MSRSNPASRAFWGLAGLSFGMLALLAFLLVWQAPQIARGVWLACQDAFSAVGGYLPLIGLALPLAVVVIAAVRFARSLAVQLWNTRLLVLAAEQRLTPRPASLDELAANLGLDGRLHLVDDESAYTFCGGLRFG